MDLLAGYGEDAGDDSATNSPKDFKVKSAHVAGAQLENEWLSFEKMIAPGGIQGEGTVDRSTYLVDGVVAYPGMSIRKPSMSDILPEVQSSETNSEEEPENEDKNKVVKNDKEGEEDDAFFMLRKQIKEQDRSSSSDGSSDSSSDSSGSPSPKRGSLSPPRLSPVNSVKSHGSEPPELIHSDSAFKTEDKTEEIMKEPQLVEEKNDKEKSIDKDRKRSHRDRSRSKSKKHRSRSKSRDRKHRHSSRDRRRHKDKKNHHKSRDNKSIRDRKSSHSKDRKRSKSRDRKRSRSKDKHESKSKSRIKRRDGSRDKKRDKRSKSRSHSKDRKRSKSRDRKERRERSKDRKKTHSSRNRHGSKERKSRSRSKHRSRSRDRSRERLRSRSPVLGKKLTFKEQMRQNILTASKQMSQDKDSEVPAKRLNESLKPSDLLRGIRINSGESVTPQQALIQTMAAMHQKAQEITGIEVPKYYNPAAVNPLKYAEQVQKRKLLWSKKTDDKQKEKEDQIETQWKSAFIADDNATTSKFRKLMGMKEGDAAPESLEKMSDEQRKKQQELFQRLDQEYQFARMTTHTQRGVGLGFSSTVYDPNHPANPP